MADMVAGLGDPFARIAELEQRNAQLEARIAELQKSIRASIFQLRVYLPVVDDAPDNVAYHPIPCAALAEGAGEQAEPIDLLSTLNGAARKLLDVIVSVAPTAISWQQAAKLADLNPTGGHFGSGRRQLLKLGLVRETTSLNGVKRVELADGTPWEPKSNGGTT